MNEPLAEESYENQVNQKCNEDLFPLCIDACFYGNESRFINHSCEPNMRTINLVSNCESQTFHSIGLFAIRKVLPGEELTIDY